MSKSVRVDNESDKFKSHGCSVFRLSLFYCPLLADLTVCVVNKILCQNIYLRRYAK